MRPDSEVLVALNVRQEGADERRAAVVYCLQTRHFLVHLTQQRAKRHLHKNTREDMRGCLWQHRNHVVSKPVVSGLTDVRQACSLMGSSAQSSAQLKASTAEIGPSSTPVLSSCFNETPTKPAKPSATVPSSMPLQPKVLKFSNIYKHINMLISTNHTNNASDPRFLGLFSVRPRGLAALLCFAKQRPGSGLLAARLIHILFIFLAILFSYL